MKKFKVKRKAKPIQAEDLLVTEEIAKKEVHTPKRRQRNTLPSDEYKPMFEPVEQQISENSKLVLSVKRTEPDGLIHAFVETYQTTPLSEGFVPKKRLDFPLEYLPDVVELLQQLSDTCEELDLNRKVEELRQY